MSDQHDKPTFQISEYYELLALHSVLWIARFTENPIKPEIPGSPFLADIANRIVEVLAKMEVERGKPERAKDWQIRTEPNSRVWQVAVQNASRHPNYWRNRPMDEKRAIARIFLSPLVITEEMHDKFVRQVDERNTSSHSGN